MNIEEKAKRYAQSVVEESVENYIGYEIYNSHIEYASQCYTAGYTQAVTDLSAEKEKLREALREIIEECEAWTFPTGQRVNDNNYNHSVDIGDLKLLIAKAKQLIIEYDKKSI